MNWAQTKKKLAKALRARDSRLYLMTAQDKDVKKS